MATDIHALVQNADDLDRLLTASIDYEMGPTGEAEISGFQAGDHSPFPISVGEVPECIYNFQIIPVGLVF